MSKGSQYSCHQLTRSDLRLGTGVHCDLCRDERSVVLGVELNSVPSLDVIPTEERSRSFRVQPSRCRWANPRAQQDPLILAKRLGERGQDRGRRLSADVTTYE